MSTHSIPTSWALAPIAELLAPLEDGRLLHHGWSPQCQKVPAKTDHEWGVLKTTSVQPGAFRPEQNKRLPEKLVPRPNLEVRPGDLLLTCAGPRARCGVPCLVRETRPRLILSGKMYRFRAQQGLIEPRYLEAFLLASSAQAAIDRMKTGISDSGLNLTHGRFKKLGVVLPPFREQYRIVEAIESYFTRLDDAVATLERVQRNLKRYRASVLQTAVEGRLVPTEAELARTEGRDYEPASVLLDRILSERRRCWEEAELARMKAKGAVPKDGKWKEKYKEPVAPDTEDLPDLPEGWGWASVEQLASNLPRSIQSGPFGSNLLHSEFQASGRLVVGIDNVQDGYFAMGSEHRISESKFRALEKYQARAGDVLVTVMATIGRCCVIPDDLEQAIITKHVYRISTEPELVNPRFLHLALWGGPIVRDQMFAKAQGQTRPGLNGTIIKRLCIPLPPRREQDRIVPEADRLLSIGAESHSALAATTQRCAPLRQSILKWAFEGRLVDQDPTDEPASKLLERIRAERESTNPNPRRKPRHPETRSRKA